MLCDLDKGWHVQARWPDGVTMTVFEPGNGGFGPIRKGTDMLILDIRDCQKFIELNPQEG